MLAGSRRLPEKMQGASTIATKAAPRRKSCMAAIPHSCASRRTQRAASEWQRNAGPAMATEAPVSQTVLARRLSNASFRGGVTTTSAESIPLRWSSRQRLGKQTLTHIRHSGRDLTQDNSPNRLRTIDSAKGTFMRDAIYVMAYVSMLLLPCLVWTIGAERRRVTLSLIPQETVLPTWNGPGD
jgi:hypothetical protein